MLHYLPKAKLSARKKLLNIYAINLHIYPKDLGQKDNSQNNP